MAKIDAVTPKLRTAAEKGLEPLPEAPQDQGRSSGHGPDGPTPKTQPWVAALGGFRHYGHEDVRRLRFIRRAQTAGFTLEEIRELLELDAGEDRTRARELAKSRIKALNERIAELQGARDSLKHLAHECVECSSGPCPI